jgi:hypothetical protein
MTYLSKIKMQDGDGNDLSSTLVDTKQALDVNVADSIPIKVISRSGFSPDPSSNVTLDSTSLLVDTAGQLIARSTVLTDEDSYRDDFIGSSLITVLSGTATFVNDSIVVEGIGTNFSTSVLAGDYIRLSSESETFFAIVAHVHNDLSLELDEGYLGVGGTGAVSSSRFATTTGVGSTFSVASSSLSIAMPVTTGIESSIIRHGDYGPLKIVSLFSIDNRRADQNINFGLSDNLLLPSVQAIFQFSGTTNTSLICITGDHSSSLETSNVEIPLGLTTSTEHLYEINLSDDTVEFSIDKIVVARHSLHIPSTYQVLDYGFSFLNTGTVAGVTNLSSDFILFKNFDSLEVATNSSSKPLNVTLSTPALVKGSITSNQSVSTLTSGNTSLGFEVLGTWTGSLSVEGLVGSTWIPLDCFSSTAELIDSVITFNDVFILINVAGLSAVRVIGDTVLSGTALITLSANNGSFTYPIFARGQGDTIGSYGIQMGGIDASTSTFQFQKVNTLGAGGVYLESSNKASYRATVIPFSPASTPSDIISINGSATKTIRVLRMTLNCTQTTTGISDWYVLKRSTANTATTPTVVTPTANDSNYDVATATVKRYVTNPSALGTFVGNYAIVNVLSPPVAPAGTSATAYVPYLFDWTNNPIVLRGADEGLHLNFNDVSRPAGLQVNCIIEWTEE